MRDGAGWTLFLDFDGTLVEIAERPEAVVVEPGLTRASMPRGSGSSRLSDSAEQGSAGRPCSRRSSTHTLGLQKCRLAGLTLFGSIRVVGDLLALAFALSLFTVICATEARE